MSLVSRLPEWQRRMCSANFYVIIFGGEHPFRLCWQPIAVLTPIATACRQVVTRMQPFAKAPQIAVANRFPPRHILHRKVVAAVFGRVALRHGAIFVLCNLGGRDYKCIETNIYLDSGSFINGSIGVGRNLDQVSRETSGRNEGERKRERTPTPCVPRFHILTGAPCLPCSSALHPGM